MSDRSTDLPRALSIVVPTHNTVALTRRCLETVFAAVDQRCEVIVVDDGSSDGSAAALREQFPSVVLLRNDAAQGFSRAASRGVTAARAPLIWLLNSDTEVAAGCIDILLSAFAANPTLGIAGAQLHHADGSPQWSGGRAPGLLWLFVLTSGVAKALRGLRPYSALRPVHRAETVAVDWVTGAAMAMRRSLWDALGPFDGDFVCYGQDLDLCLRAGRAGWRIELLAGLRVLHHHGATIMRESSASRENHRLLWLDLLRWAHKQHGPAWASRARLAMLAGAHLRISARWICSVLPPRRADATWRKETTALREAARAIRQWSATAGA